MAYNDFDPDNMRRRSVMDQLGQPGPAMPRPGPAVPRVPGAAAPRDPRADQTYGFAGERAPGGGDYREPTPVPAPAAPPVVPQQSRNRRTDPSENPFLDYFRDGSRVSPAQDRWEPSKQLDRLGNEVPYSVVPGLEDWGEFGTFAPDPNSQFDPQQRMSEILSRYDPSKGLTNELKAELDKAGLGNYYLGGRQTKPGETARRDSSGLMEFSSGDDVWGRYIKDNLAPTPASGGSQDYRAIVEGLLKGQAYGPQGLANIEADLAKHGIRLQKDSGGRVRGRIFLPDGRTVDLPGAGEGNDWWSNPTASGWGWTDRGVQGQSGPSAAPPPPSAGMSPMPSGGGGSADLSPYLQGDAAARIRAELEALIRGDQSPMSREALKRFLDGPGR